MSPCGVSPPWQSAAPVQPAGPSMMAAKMSFWKLTLHIGSTVQAPPEVALPPVGLVPASGRPKLTDSSDAHDAMAAPNVTSATRPRRAAVAATGAATLESIIELRRLGFDHRS